MPVNISTISQATDNFMAFISGGNKIYLYMQYTSEGGMKKK